MTEADLKERADAIYRSLCGNHLTASVAAFLAELDMRLTKLEQAREDGGADGELG